VPEVTINAIRANEPRAESLDSAPVYLAVFLEFREVMDKSGVNHAIGSGRSAAQAFQVFKEHLDALGHQRR